MSADFLAFLALPGNLRGRTEPSRSTMIRRLCLSAAVALSPLAAAAADAPAAAKPPAPAAAPAAATKGPEDAAWVHLRVPIFADEFQSVPVAQVEDEVITLREVTDALATMHQARAEKGTGKVDIMPVVDRLIDVRLVAVEAKNTGIDTMPDVEATLKDYRTSAARELLQQRVTKDVKGDPALIDRLFKDSVQQFKGRSILFANESEAKKLKAACDAGGKFEELAKRAVDEGKAKGGQDAQILPRDKLLPAVLAVLERMKPGEVSAPLALNEGWAVMKLEEVQYPENAAARARVEGIARQEAVKAALKTYYGEVSKRFAVIDQKLLKSLDFEAKKPGLAVLKKDRRPLARIKADKDITVADLAAALESGFFHGVEGASKKHRVNRSKLDVFDGLLAAKIVPLEVKRLGIDTSPEYLQKVEAYRTGLLFSTFLGRVIGPKVQVTDEAVRKHYDEHRKDYTYPAFYKLESLAFASAKDAQDAVQKLGSGTDFKWLNANSEQLKPGERAVKIEGVLAAGALPKELAAALSGAKAGDQRLYAHPEPAQYYAVHVVDVVQPQEQPFEEVQGKIREKLFYDQLNVEMKDWIGKLRKAANVKVFITKVGS
jgi:parvulin-like peptidyl-prolyl isomerase